jgi:hypothetical protein
MRGAKAFFCAAIVVSLSIAPSDAGTIKPLIDGLGIHDEHFNDITWERVIDVDNDTFISPGDILEGVFDFESFGKKGGTIGIDRWSVGRAASDTVEATGYFSLQVVSVTPSGGLFPFYAVQLGPDPGFEATYGQGAMAVAFEDAAKNFNAGLPVNQVIANAKDGTHLVTVGFTGAGGAPGPGEMWGAVAQTNSIAAAQVPSFAFGFYQANLNRVFSAGFQNDLWSLQIPQVQPNALLGGFTEFSLNGQLYGAGPASTLPVSGSTEVLFTVIPEPSTLVGLLMGAFFALMGYAWAGRKR